jgi:hypothetical protein
VGFFCASQSLIVTGYQGVIAHRANAFGDIERIFAANKTGLRRTAHNYLDQLAVTTGRSRPETPAGLTAEGCRIINTWPLMQR